MVLERLLNKDLIIKAGNLGGKTNYDSFNYIDKTDA